MQKELEDAARDTRPISPDRSSLKEGNSGLPTAVPTKVSVTFVRWQNFNLWNYFNYEITLHYVIIMEILVQMFINSL